MSPTGVWRVQKIWMGDTSGQRGLGTGIVSLKETGIEKESVALVAEDVLLEMEVEGGTGWTGGTDSQDGRRTVITVEEDGRETEAEIAIGTEIEIAKGTVTETGENGESGGVAKITTETGDGTLESGSEETEGGVREEAETETVGNQARTRRAKDQGVLNAGRGLHDGTLMIV